MLRTKGFCKMSDKMKLSEEGKLEVLFLYLLVPLLPATAPAEIVTHWKDRIVNPCCLDWDTLFGKIKSTNIMDDDSNGGEKNLHYFYSLCNHFHNSLFCFMCLRNVCN